MHDSEDERAGRRFGLGQILLGILGLLLLLPGACGVFVIALIVNDPNDPFVEIGVAFSVLGLLVGALGVWLLRRVIRNARSGRS